MILWVGMDTVVQDDLDSSIEIIIKTVKKFSRIYMFRSGFLNVPQNQINQKTYVLKAGLLNMNIFAGQNIQGDLDVCQNLMIKKDLLRNEIFTFLKGVYT
jgi:hypothetical protein